MSGFPILVEGSAIDVLVVGGGTVASRKAAVLIEAGARVRVVAPKVSDALRALADAGRVVVAERRYARADIGDAHLVIAATDDRAVNAAVTADAHAAARLVNVADM
ncbi:MAG TPA: NAD(P)-dependent oxidoreductase, partial [Gemmatimonadaceae bacterium]|nr:NAD(P)-dependent oxidoreductase [Gemmatimonadaceae bacterium]